MPPLSPIRVAPGGRYFETFDGAPFLFIGPNDAVPWPGLGGLFRRRDLETVDAYLADLAANGVTVLRLMLEYAHREGRYFERRSRKKANKGALEPNPEMVRLWDDLFARCEQHGLRVFLTPWDTFWMTRRWNRHPYNRVNGGPADRPGDFFTREAVIEATIRRFRFVITRWGGSGVIAAWDLFNEIDPHWGGSPAVQSAVITRLSEAIRAAERTTWGFTRPQTLSVYGPEPTPEYENLLFRHPCLDFVTTHVYHSEAIDQPKDTVAPALSMARWVRHARARIPLNRPYLDSEHGPIHLFNYQRRYLPEAFDDEYERHLMWAHLATGGAGSGMRWPARDPHVLTAGMRQALGGLSRFSRLIDWRHFAPTDADLTTDHPDILTFGVCDTRQAMLYLLRNKPGARHKGTLPEREPICGAMLTLRGLSPERYCVHAWNTVEGRSAGRRKVAVGAEGALRCEIPPLTKDLAVAVLPA